MDSNEFIYDQDRGLVFFEVEPGVWHYRIYRPFVVDGIEYEVQSAGGVHVRPMVQLIDDAAGFSYIGQGL